jgi:integrase
LHVADSKTDAGVCDVTLQPALRDELAALKARTANTGPEAFVFATAAGGRPSEDNVRSRVFNAVVKRANERRAERDLPPLPKITPHSLRRTYISALFALGWELPVVMAEVGHCDPKVTLGIYAQVMRRDQDARERLAALLGFESAQRSADSGPAHVVVGR